MFLWSLRVCVRPPPVRCGAWVCMCECVSNQGASVQPLPTKNQAPPPCPFPNGFDVVQLNVLRQPLPPPSPQPNHFELSVCVRMHLAAAPKFKFPFKKWASRLSCSQLQQSGATS